MTSSVLQKHLSEHVGKMLSGQLEAAAQDYDADSHLVVITNDPTAAAGEGDVLRQLRVAVGREAILETFDMVKDLLISPDGLDPGRVQMTVTADDAVGRGLLELRVNDEVGRPALVFNETFRFNGLVISDQTVVVQRLAG